MSITPDALLDFYLTAKQGQLGMPVFLEHDRGTKERQYFWRRIRGYVALLNTDAIQERFGVSTITDAFATLKGKKRLEQMRGWTEEELQVINEPW